MRTARLARISAAPPVRADYGAVEQQKAENPLFTAVRAHCVVGYRRIRAGNAMPYGNKNESTAQNASKMYCMVGERAASSFVNAASDRLMASKGRPLPHRTRAPGARWQGPSRLVSIFRRSSLEDRSPGPSQPITRGTERAIWWRRISSGLGYEPISSRCVTARLKLVGC
jgi:hypothetical protein